MHDRLRSENDRLSTSELDLAALSRQTPGRRRLEVLDDGGATQSWFRLPKKFFGMGASRSPTAHLRAPLRSLPVSGGEGVMGTLTPAAVTPTRVAAQYQEVLPVVHPIVRRQHCRDRTLHGVQTPGAGPHMARCRPRTRWGLAAVQLGLQDVRPHGGPQQAAQAVAWHRSPGGACASASSIALTTSTVSNSLLRFARHCLPIRRYAGAVFEGIRGSPVVAPNSVPSWTVDAPREVVVHLCDAHRRRSLAC